MKLTLLCITLGLSVPLLASPRTARAQSYPETQPDAPPRMLHHVPKVALAVGFPVTASAMSPGGALAGAEISTLFRVKAGSMLGATFAFQRSLAAPKDMTYRYLPAVDRLTDVALDLRYEGRFRLPDAVAPWISLGTGPFLRIAEGTGGTDTRARRFGWDVVRLEGGVDTRTQPLSVGIFGQVRMTAASECGGAFFAKNGDDVHYADAFCDEGPRLGMWIGGGLRAVLSGG